MNLTAGQLLLSALPALVLAVCKASGVAGNRYRFLLTNDPRVDAWTWPSGLILVHEHFIHNVTVARFLPALIAHEVGHHQERHFPALR